MVLFPKREIARTERYLQGKGEHDGQTMNNRALEDPVELCPAFVPNLHVLVPEYPAENVNRLRAVLEGHADEDGNYDSAEAKLPHSTELSQLEVAFYQQPLEGHHRQIPIVDVRLVESRHLAATFDLDCTPVLDSSPRKQGLHETLLRTDPQVDVVCLRHVFMLGMRLRSRPGHNRQVLGLGSLGNSARQTSVCRTSGGVQRIPELVLDIVGVDRLGEHPNKPCRRCEGRRGRRTDPDAPCRRGCRRTGPGGSLRHRRW
mmetsp:Transcript_85744/g.239760  ORF Transcript_85744/g.239760 Transcript_85744/m.239760 type:complete len:259 (+) Transcript_85744:625-1401(+)